MSMGGGSVSFLVRGKMYEGQVAQRAKTSWDAWATIEFPGAPGVQEYVHGHGRTKREAIRKMEELAEYKLCD